MTNLNIYQRLNEVRKKVSYLQKDADVQGYKAITHDAVTSFARQHFIDNGILVVPSQIDGELRDANKTTKHGVPYTFYIGRYQFDFVNIDNPEDRVSVVVDGIGEDLNDKGPGKALSYAKKSAILKILEIETGESEESRYEQQHPETITDDQAANITSLIEEVGADKQRFLTYIGAADVENIIAKDYDKAISALEAKRDS